MVRSRARGALPAAALGPLVGLGCRHLDSRPPPPRRWLTAAPRGERATRAEQRRIAWRKKGAWAMASPRRARRRRRRLVCRRPLRWPRRPVRRRRRRRHQASRRRRQHRRLLRRLLRFQLLARASRRCATSALVLERQSTSPDQSPASRRGPTRPCAPGCTAAPRAPDSNRLSSFPTCHWTPTSSQAGACGGRTDPCGCRRRTRLRSTYLIPLSGQPRRRLFAPSFCGSRHRRVPRRRFRELPHMRCGVPAVFVAASTGTRTHFCDYPWGKDAASNRRLIKGSVFLDRLSENF